MAGSGLRSCKTPSGPWKCLPPTDVCLTGEPLAGSGEPGSAAWCSYRQVRVSWDPGDGDSSGGATRRALAGFSFRGCHPCAYFPPSFLLLISPACPKPPATTLPLLHARPPGSGWLSIISTFPRPAACCAISLQPQASSQHTDNLPV